MYVRRRTEPVKSAGENCAHTCQLLRKRVHPTAVRESSKAWFARFPDAGNFEFDYQRTITMLYTIAVVLIILWLLGLATSYTMGGLIHVLLVIAIVVVLLRVISGRNPL